MKNSADTTSNIINKSSGDRNELTVIKGRPKSGRIWKNDKKRASSIVKTRGLRVSFDRKQALKTSLKQIKELSRARKEQLEQEKRDKKMKRKQNLERQEENRKKSEVVQIITNTAKIKKMKKKLLRKIEKRDVTCVK